MAAILRRRKGGNTNGSKQEQFKVIKVNRSISSSSLGDPNQNPRSYSIELDAILNGVR